jgi:hypothetical protein
MKRFQVCILSLIAFVTLSIGAGFSSGMVGALTWGPTVDFWAMSIAISRNKFELPGYLGYREVAQVLANTLTTTKSDINVNDEGTRDLVRQPELVTLAISNAASLSKSDLKLADKKSGGYITTIAEDVGYVDFYSLAFILFGYTGIATHILYMLLLSVSIVAYISQFKRDSICLFLLGISVVSLFLVTNSNALNESVPSIASNRFTSTLGIIPLAHLLILMVPNNRTNIRIKLLVFQAAILVFSILCRSSGQWMLVNLFMVSFSLSLLYLYSNKLSLASIIKRASLIRNINGMPAFLYVVFIITIISKIFTT